MRTLEEAALRLEEVAAVLEGLRLGPAGLTARSDCERSRSRALDGSDSAPVDSLASLPNALQLCRGLRPQQNTTTGRHDQRE